MQRNPHSYQIATGYRTFYSLSLIYQPITKKRLFLLKKVAYSYCRIHKNTYLCNRKTGKSYTASSLRILQGLIAAKVVGCSGAI